MNFVARLASRGAPNGVALARVTGGAVFLAECLQKLLFPADAGAGTWSLDAWLHRRLAQPQECLTAA